MFSFSRLTTHLLVTFSSIIAVICTWTGSAQAYFVPNGGTYFLSGLSPFADPAAGGTSGSGVQLYSTNNLVGQAWWNIPTETWSPVATNSTIGQTDALPQASINAFENETGETIDTGGTWAPTVANIDGEYVMWFVGLRGDLDNLGSLVVADSPSPTGPFTIRNSIAWTGTNYGFFDPTLWEDPFTSPPTWWLTFSVEESGNPAVNIIYSRELSANGETLVGAAYALDSYGAVDGELDPTFGGCCNAGTNPFIENPAFAVDPRGTYRFNLMMSFGTFNDVKRYWTTIAPCVDITGPCYEDGPEMNAYPSLVAPSIGTYWNVGGASFVEGSPAWEDLLMPFHASTGSNVAPRDGYYDSTNSQILSGGEVLRPASSLNYGTNYCLCDPNGWAMGLVGNANLVLTDNAGTTRWSSGTNGSSGWFATMQTDGNFVIYDQNNVPHWWTNTAGKNGAYLFLDNTSGALSIYSSSNQPICQLYPSLTCHIGVG
jgi:hypothetical protein